jgi:hypothetical protein
MFYFDLIFLSEFGAILVAGRADRHTLPGRAVGATGFPFPARLTATTMTYVSTTTTMTA